MVDMFDGCCFSAEELLLLRARMIDAVVREDSHEVRCFFHNILRAINERLTILETERARSKVGDGCA